MNGNGAGDAMTLNMNKRRRVFLALILSSLFAAIGAQWHITFFIVFGALCFVVFSGVAFATLLSETRE